MARPPRTSGGRSATSNTRTASQPTTAPALGRPRKGYKSAMFRLLPEQHEALTDTAIRARLDRKPNAGEGASLIVRHLVQDWMDDGAKWPDV